MIESGLDPTVVNGAEFVGLGGDRQVSAAYRPGGKNNFIFEACEYTDSFLSFFPTTAVVTNVELDHVDYFHSLEQYIGSFTRYINIADIAVVNFDSPNAKKAAAGFGGKLVSFGITAEDALYRARGISYNEGCARFTLTRDGVNVCDIALSVAGEHNIYNAMAAAAASLENGASPEAVSSGLAIFCGARRRFELKGELNGAHVYDDYAHHPSEIRATLAAARRIAGKGRIICVFQPHSLSRTTGLFDGFIKAFGDADIVVFTDIYENLEHDNGKAAVTSADLAAAVSGSRYIRDFGEIAVFLQSEAHEGDIVIMMGAGNIYRVCDKIIKNNM
jgi:UDP-N-acetylmuramate--alanine ligase